MKVTAPVHDGTGIRRHPPQPSHLSLFKIFVGNVRRHNILEAEGAIVVRFDLFLDLNDVLGVFVLGHVLEEEALQLSEVLHRANCYGVTAEAIAVPLQYIFGSDGVIRLEVDLPCIK